MGGGKGRERGIWLTMDGDSIVKRLGEVGWEDRRGDWVVGWVDGWMDVGWERHGHVESVF